MKEIRDLLDTDAPIIYEGGWDRHCREGWRWLKNVLLWNVGQATAVIRNAQAEYGHTNVAAGHPFSSDRLKPVNDPSGKVIGIYVCDVEHQVELLRKNFTIDPRKWPATDPKRRK